LSQAEPRRVALTGASGFLGLNLLAGLLNSDSSVTAISRHPEEAEDLIRVVRRPLAATSERADVNDTNALVAILEQARPDVLIHSAAITPIREDLEREGFAETVQTNILGSVSVLEAARRCGVRIVVYVSSGTVYGNRTSLRPLLETDRTTPSGVYGITKQSAERLWLRHAELFERAARVVRVSVPYGPWERPSRSRGVTSPMPKWCRSALEGRGVREPVDIARDFTYVEDTVTGILRVAFSPRTRHHIYNVSSGNLYWYSDVLPILATLHPGFIYEVGPKLSRGSVAVPRRGPLSIARVATEFEWQPAFSLEQGLRKYLAWIEKHPNSTAGE
jgi:UDP-glucose 4-epimerase